MVRAVLAPFRTMFALLVVVLATLLLGSYVIVLLKIRPRTRQITSIMRLWARVFLRASGTDLKVEGLEHLDPTASYVFSGNHISNIDIPGMIASLPVSVRFLAKAERSRWRRTGTPSGREGENPRRARRDPAAHHAINE